MNPWRLVICVQLVIVGLLMLILAMPQLTSVDITSIISGTLNPGIRQWKLEGGGVDSEYKYIRQSGNTYRITEDSDHTSSITSSKSEKKQTDIDDWAHTGGYDEIPARFLTNELRWKSTIQEQRERQATMKRACSKYNKTPFKNDNEIHRRIRQRLKVDDSRKVMYCLTPKAGSTNWLRMLINMTTHGTNPEAVIGHVHDDHHLKRYGLTTMLALNDTERPKRLSTYSRLILVRHPMYRWLSAFRQKMTLRAYLRTRQKIVETYRPGASQQTIEEGKPSFEEFLRYILHIGITGKFSDHHWAPYSFLCDPCSLDYDYIIKLETQNEDIAFLKDVLYDNAPQAVMGNKYYNFTEANIFRDYYNAIPFGLLHKLVDVYSEDFDMFGYDVQIGDLKL